MSITSADAAPADLKQRLKNTYDEIAPKYNAWTNKHTAQRLDYLNNLLLRLPTDARVLELGCGGGVPVGQSILAHSPSIHLIANDLSNTQIALARESLSAEAASGRVTFLEGDMTTLDISEHSLDAVVAIYSLIHLPRGEQVALLGTIARKWLKPGGYLLANFSDEDTGEKGVVFEGWMGPNGWTFYSGLGVEATRRAAEDVGFDVLLGEVAEDVVKAKFFWMIAKKTA